VVLAGAGENPVLARNDGATFADVDILVGIEAESSGVADGAALTVLVSDADRLASSITNNLCFFAIAMIASMLQGRLSMCTGMMARVFGVIFRSMSAGSMVRLSSMSTSPARRRPSPVRLRSPSRCRLARGPHRRDRCPRRQGRRSGRWFPIDRQNVLGTDHCGEPALELVGKAVLTLKAKQPAARHGSADRPPLSDTDVRHGPLYRGAQGPLEPNLRNDCALAPARQCPSKFCTETPAPCLSTVLSPPCRNVRLRPTPWQARNGRPILGIASALRFRTGTDAQPGHIGKPGKSHRRFFEVSPEG
jgi:hypothetical protein